MAGDAGDCARLWTDAATEVAHALAKGAGYTSQPLIWERVHSTEVRTLGTKALAFRDERLAGARAYGEVAVRRPRPQTPTPTMPWDTEETVLIPGTGFRIRGYLDRLDISADGPRRAAFSTTRRAGRPRRTSHRPSMAVGNCNGASTPLPSRQCWARDVTIKRIAFLRARGEENLPLADPDATLRDDCRLPSTSARTASRWRAATPSWGSIPAGTTTISPSRCRPMSKPLIVCGRRLPPAARLGDATQVWEVDVMAAPATTACR